MYPIFLVFLAVSLFSCSSSRIERKIAQSHLDAMGDESLIRWDTQRLSSLPSSLANVCYKDGYGELKFKEQYQQESSKEFYWIQLGNCYFLAEKWSKAEFYYRFSETSLNNKLKAAALNNLALIAFKYQQWAKGRTLLKEALSLNPSSRVLRYNLAQLYTQFGQFDNALDLLSHHIFNGAKDIDLFLSLGVIWLYKGDYEKAESYLNRIPETYLEREDVASILSLVELKKANLKRAKKFLEARNRSHVPELTVISQKLDKLINTRLQQE